MLQAWSRWKGGSISTARVNEHENVHHVLYNRCRLNKLSPLVSCISFSKNGRSGGNLLETGAADRMVLICNRMADPAWGPSWHGVLAWHPHNWREQLGLVEEQKNRKSHGTSKGILLDIVWFHFPWQHPHCSPYHSSLELITYSQPLAYSRLSLQTVTVCQINLPARGLCTCTSSTLMPAIDPSGALSKIKLRLFNQSIWHILIFFFPAVLSKGSVWIQPAASFCSEKTKIPFLHTASPPSISPDCALPGPLGHAPLEKCPFPSCFSAPLRMYPGMTSYACLYLPLC